MCLTIYVFEETYYHQYICTWSKHFILNNNSLNFYKWTDTFMSLMFFNKLRYLKQDLTVFQSISFQTFDLKVLS